MTFFKVAIFRLNEKIPPILFEFPSNMHKVTIVFIPALNITPPKPKLMILMAYNVEATFELLEKFEEVNSIVLPKKTIQLP